MQLVLGGKTCKPTKKSDSKALQDASPLPEEEIAPGVRQETYYSAGEGDEKVSDGQVDYDVVQGLSQLLELESDEHHQEVFAQRQRGDHEHEHRQDGEVPRRDVPDGRVERVVGGGQLGRHGERHRVHGQAQSVHRPGPRRRRLLAR